MRASPISKRLVGRTRAIYQDQETDWKAPGWASENKPSVN